VFHTVNFKNASKTAGWRMARGLSAAYRLHAAHCIEIAGQTADSESKLSLLNMARAWVLLAHQAEKNSETVLYEFPRPVSRASPNSAFDPEAIEAMSRAYRGACHTLGLADRDDALNKMVAQYLITLAQTGMRSPTDLYAATVKEFKSRNTGS
jgi:hypothetical protein